MPLIPGETVTATITLDQCAYRLPAGHRLRVAISTAYWPAIWPSPRRATVTLTEGRLSLPLRPLAQGDEWRFEPPEGATPWATETLRPSAFSRRIKNEAGEISVIVENDFGALRDLDHGLINDSHMREVWTISPENPLSARAEIAWHQAGGRGDWQWRTEATSQMRATASEFIINAQLRAYEDNRLVHDREFSARIPRRML